MRHQRALLRASDVVFAQTPREAAFIASVGVPSPRIVVAGIGIDPSEVAGGNAARARAMLGTPSSVVLALGTQSADKGTLGLLAALERLWTAGVDTDLVLVGAVQPEVDISLKRLAQSTRRHIHVLGAVVDATKRDLLAACDILVLPSRAESFGIVILEAWANAKAVVGARAGGLPDVIDDGNTGLLVPFGDATALAGALGRLLANPSLRSDLGRAGHAKLMARYTWQAVYPTIREAYEQFDPARR